MTALAFLFAVFLARPCPFYILDEVEAALDDLNLDRFLDLLRRHSSRAQFIVITHQKRTMEAADWLYGVSMGRDGVSKVVSRRRTAGREPPRSPTRPEAAAATRRPWPRDWSELLITARAADGFGRPPARGAETRRRAALPRLRESMARTREALGSEIQATFQGALDAAAWERLEEALIMADVGAPATAARSSASWRPRRPAKDGQRADRAPGRAARADGDASASTGSTCARSRQ